MYLQVTSGMVISTFLSAPIMYVSSWLLTIPLMDPTPLVTELENVSFNISIISLLALVRVLDRFQGESLHAPSGPLLKAIL